LPGLFCAPNDCHPEERATFHPVRPHHTLSFRGTRQRSDIFRRIRPGIPGFPRRYSTRPQRSTGTQVRWP
jgi:hypothetical protein